jgi:peptide/nickel transport system substrate-binding protein
MYMLGWGGSITEPDTIFTPVWRNRGPNGIGFFNYRNFEDDTLDALVAAASREPDVGVVHRPDNWLEVMWITIKSGRRPALHSSRPGLRCPRRRRPHARR